MLPPVGSVLGVDVGFSPSRRSSAACRLDWDGPKITWKIRRFRAIAQERVRVIAEVAGTNRLEAAAFDGPLRRGLDPIGRYRIAEQMLTRRLGPKIGKPGQSSAPVGKSLNAAANDCAKTVLEICDVGPARHAVSIDERAIVEAFPSSFLGLLFREPPVDQVGRGDRSDVFFTRLAAAGRLDDLVARLMPVRVPPLPFGSVTNHDDRAALVCALTALCVAAGKLSAVGDGDGWIILPPAGEMSPWAIGDLEANECDSAQGAFYR